MGSNREGACKRWSAKRKAEIVVRLFKGERLDALSRETGQSAVKLSGWREEFLEGGAAMLKRRSDDDPQLQTLAAERQRLQSKVGELTMANELLYEKSHRLEDNCPLGRRRSK
jgi:transposase